MSDVIVNLQNVKKSFCTLHKCEEDYCPFYNECRPGANVVEKWLLSCGTELQIYEDARQQIKQKILKNTEPLNKENIGSLVEYINNLIEEKKKSCTVDKDEFVKATIYLVGESGYKVPYGTFDYLTTTQQRSVMQTAKRISKDFNCKYEIVPIKRKDLDI